MIADEIIKIRYDNIQLINVSKLKIFPCEGNVSTKKRKHMWIKIS
jgi:hypothetical protein